MIADASSILGMTDDIIVVRLNLKVTTFSLDIIIIIIHVTLESTYRLAKSKDVDRIEAETLRHVTSLKLWYVDVLKYRR